MHAPIEKSSEQKRYQETRKVTLVGSVVDLVLAVAKVAVGFISNSQALIADGIHSFSDLVTDVMVLFAAKHGSQEADADHPYGHARYETIATVALGIALILVGFGIAYDAIRRLYEPELLFHPGWMAFIVACISIVAKEAIFRYTMHVANKLRSNLLRANAWHSRSDAISSVIVAIGVLGSIAGLEYLDSIAAIGVAFMIAKIGADFSWHSIRELVDTGLDTEIVEKIKDVIRSVKGVESLHFLRTRRMGADALVDVHIQVGPKVSVSEGHQISESVRQKLIAEVNEVSEVLVHIDPEDDEVTTSSDGLPLREDVLQKLNQEWRDIPLAENIEDVTLHYLDGKIHPELRIPLHAVKDIQQARDAAEEIRQACKKIEEIGDVRIDFTSASK